MSTIWMLIRSSLRERLLSTCVTILSIALAAGLAMATVVIDDQSYTAFTAGAPGFNAVLGARGSQLQLVLNSVFHLETSPGNLPWSAYMEMKARPGVELAVPYAVGDAYAGFQIVGTTPERFTDLKLDGRCFTENALEAVIGSTVAERAGLKVGATFQPSHGVGGEKHPETFTVVGLLEPTNTPEDRAIWIPIEGVFRMTGHVLRGGGTEYHAGSGPIPDEHKEVSAVMLRLDGPQTGMALENEVNRLGKTSTLAWPIGKVMGQVFEQLGWVERVLWLVSWLVVLVACASILASLYNATLARLKEFAILRALGARRSTVFLTILGESAFQAWLGGLLGLLVHLAIMEGAAWAVRAQTGVHLQVFAFHWVLLAVPVSVTVLGAVAGVIPALMAYETDVAANL